MILRFIKSGMLFTCTETSEGRFTLARQEKLLSAEGTEAMKPMEFFMILEAWRAGGF
jgi:hypothetical protein